MDCAFSKAVVSGLWDRLLCLGCRCLGCGTDCCVWVVGQAVVSGLWDRLLCLGCGTGCCVWVVGQAVVSGL